MVVDLDAGWLGGCNFESGLEWRFGNGSVEAIARVSRSNPT
jgi:hypothetical protein